MQPVLVESQKPWAKYPIYEFGGVRYHLHRTGYYMSAPRYCERLLQRCVWIHHHGAVPYGVVVHHKDRDKTNNQLDNLELLGRVAHLKLHGRDAGRFERMREVQVLGNQRTSEQRRGDSEFGKRWAAASKKNLGEVRNGSYKVLRICAGCRTEFMASTIYDTRSSIYRHCSASCEYLRRKKKIGETIPAVCSECKANFTAVVVSNPTKMRPDVVSHRCDKCRE